MNIKEYYKKSLSNIDKTIPNIKSWKLVMERNEKRKENIAISEEGHEITYGSMFNNWYKLARAFSAYDISRSNCSRVLVIMPNIAKTCDIYYAMDMTGAVCDFIDPTSSIDKIEKYIEAEKITDIIGLDVLLEQNIGKRVRDIKQNYGIRNIISCQDPYMNSLLPSYVKYYSALKNFTNRFSRSVIRLDDMIKNSKNSRIKYDMEDAQTLSLITHTSGTTTGLGKPIPITDYNRNALIKNYELAQFNYKPGMKMLHFIPYFAGYGAINTTHLGLSQGFHLQEIPLFNQPDFGILLKKYKPNIALATTSCWLNLVNDSRCQDIDLSCFAYASTGGGPTSIEDEETINNFLEKHNSQIKLTKGYGLSETCGCCIVTLDNYNRVGSIGVNHALVDVVLRNVESGEILPDDGEARGEALIHSATVTSGVLDNKVIIPLVEINGKNYLQTKDILDRKIDGSYEYVERIDRMFPRYDGYNFYPLHIEEIFKSFDEVSECVIVPYYSEVLKGHVPKAYIQLSDKYKMNEKVKLITDIISQSFLKRTRTTMYMPNFRDIPRKIVFIEKMPRNTMGKEDYHKLKNGDIDGEEYDINITETNIGISEFTVVPQ